MTEFQGAQYRITTNKNVYRIERRNRNVVFWWIFDDWEPCIFKYKSTFESLEEAKNFLNKVTKKEIWTPVE